MPIDYELRRMMPDTVTLERAGPRNAYGREQFSNPEQHQCRIELTQRLIRDQDGREAISNTTIYLAVPVPVKLVDRLTLPDGSVPSIMSVESVHDENGEYVTKLFT